MTSINTNFATRLPDLNSKRHLKIFENTYRNNTNSDYTEKMEELQKNFDYESNKHCYWGEPQLSLLYGTPLYAEASPAQKLALNHLFWVGQYNHTAATEANTVLYNQVTEGVFSHLSGYNDLCKELELETEQEYVHIRTFQQIGYKTKLALLGKKGLGDPRQTYQKKASSTRSPLLSQLKSTKGIASSLEEQQENLLRWVTASLHRNYSNCYSTYLKNKEQTDKRIPGTTGGLGGLVSQGALQNFLTLNWGSSPFLASQYYAIRMIGNMSLKCYEHHYFRYCRQLEKKGEFIPTPTAISYYHLLDESFHTTTSQFIAQELYKDFPKPTAYEKLVANLSVYMAQVGVLGGLSGIMPTVFRSDSYFELLLLRILQSPIFEMSTQDALYWLEKCLCQEHEGFHLNAQYHRRLLSEFRRFFESMEYLWPVNGEMRLMAAGGEIDKAIRKNVKSFRRFSQTIRQQ